MRQSRTHSSRTCRSFRPVRQLGVPHERHPPRVASEPRARRLLASTRLGSLQQSSRLPGPRSTFRLPHDPDRYDRLLRHVHRLQRPSFPPVASCRRRPEGSFRAPRSSDPGVAQLHPTAKLPRTPERHHLGAPRAPRTIRLHDRIRQRQDHRRFCPRSP